jgi:hypothetical protein
VLQSGYAVLDAGGFDGLRACHAALLAFVLAGEGETAAARPFIRVCETFEGELDHEAVARLRATQAQLVSGTVDAERLGRDAVEAAGRTDNLNLQAETHLVLARVLGDATEAEAARALFETKGNVVSAAAVGLWSLQP